MATQSTLSARSTRERRVNPLSNGQPDPRPVTDYTAVMTTVGGHSRLTITLSQPCVVRQPLWPVIDCVAGGLTSPTSCTIVSNTQFYFDFTGIVALSIAFVQVPCQDTQVQNFQGGFVRPGGQWFRAPVMPS